MKYFTFFRILFLIIIFLEKNTFLRINKNSNKMPKGHKNPQYILPKIKLHKKIMKKNKNGNIKRSFKELMKKSFIKNMKIEN